MDTNDWCINPYHIVPGIGIAETKSTLVHFCVICVETFIQPVNPFMPNGISLYYQLEQSISILRDARWYFSF